MGLDKWPPPCILNGAMNDKTRVLFRKDNPGNVVAIFPRTPGTLDPQTFTTFDSASGHGSGSKGWYDTTRAAKPSEYRDTASRLRRAYGYRLDIGHRFTQADDRARVEAIAAQIRA